jgi:hypothetical protein
MTPSLAATDHAASDDLYSRIPIVNFSHEVLSGRPADLGVLRADGLEWSDLGDPGRLLAAIARKGIRREWDIYPTDSGRGRAASA